MTLCYNFTKLLVICIFAKNNVWYLKDNEILYNDAQKIFQIQSISYKYTYSICMGLEASWLFEYSYSLMKRQKNVNVNSITNYDCLL